MTRRLMIGIKVNEDEKAKIERLAKSVRLAPSTAARQILLNVADRLERQGENAELQTEASN